MLCLARMSLTLRLCLEMSKFSIQLILDLLKLVHEEAFLTFRLLCILLLRCIFLHECALIGVPFEVNIFNLWHLHLAKSEISLLQFTLQ